DRAGEPGLRGGPGRRRQRVCGVGRRTHGRPSVASAGLGPAGPADRGAWGARRRGGRGRAGRFFFLDRPRRRGHRDLAGEPGGVPRRIGRGPAGPSARRHARARGGQGPAVGRVAIRGWSFGGYLAALAVLRRPDVFHAAVVGAPVTDWRLYDTHYTERYLGHPDAHPDAYERSSLLGDAAKLERPILLIHGLAD